VATNELLRCVEIGAFVVTPRRSRGPVDTNALAIATEPQVTALSTTNIK
jgi:hypothetical protein